MFLSRLILNSHSRAVQRDLANGYQLHRTVMSGFPTPLPQKERVLFRLERARDARLALLVQSQTRPEWIELVESGYLTSPDPFDLPQNPAVKTFDLTLREGQMLHFRLRANPTVKRNGKRHALYREEEQLAWLRRKGEQSGFEPAQVMLNEELTVSGRARGSEELHRLTLYVVQYEGMLQVVDAGRLQQAVANGIGPAQGFGCGLLSLAPAQ